jgi:hypothetical protein
MTLHEMIRIMVKQTITLATYLLAHYAHPTIGLPVSSNASSGVDFGPPTYHCTTFPQWGSPSFRPDDCRQVVSDFVHDEIVHWGEQTFEFVSLGAKPVTGLQPQYIPHRYIHGEQSRITEPYDSS